MRAFYSVVFVVLIGCLSFTGFAGTTGKITGTVTDSRTGDKLPSVNVVIEGTTLGAVTNPDGYFVILNIPPGHYRVKATLLGFTTAVVSNVRVDIDQTTNQDFSLSEEAIAGEEVTVVAQRPVVQRDVSASRANIEIADVEKLPVTSVAGAVQLQAGIQSGLVVRGGTLDQVAFVMDGLSLRDERTNNPYTSLALSAVQDIQVQTGGFNAEYGNIRSGIVNVVTKEGSPSSYSFSFIGRYSPADPKHFGSAIYDQNSYWIRPFIDPAVAWTGTDNGAWDPWTQKQYAAFPGGWNAVSQALMKDPDPSRHLTPEAARDLFLFEHRKQAEINLPDWDIDMGFGGPIPAAAELGNLRFFTSYRQTQSAYLIPLSADAYRDYSGTLKLTSDLSSSMKLTGSLLIGRQWGTNDNNAGNPGIFQTTDGIANLLSQVSYIDSRIWSDAYWCPTSTWYTMGGLKLSEVVNATTFYDVTFTGFRSKYQTDPGALRNTAKVYQFGPYFTDMSPLGFDPNPNPPSSIVSSIRYGLGFSDSRDSSEVFSYTFKFDLTSQLDRYNQVKTGVELGYTDNYASYAQFDFGLPRSNTFSSWHSFPWRGALYAQDKLEFQGMIANLGVRLDYLDPNGDWWDVIDPYSYGLSGSGAGGMDTLIARTRVKRILTVSPRLGIAFPISEDSKLYFNYGHFRQVPAPENLFLLRRSSFDNSVARIANPGAPFP
ncbi:MAG: TonB-dependent receptor, partial [Bacteroidota bacterium]